MSMQPPNDIAKAIRQVFWTLVLIVSLVVFGFAAPAIFKQFLVLIIIGTVIALIGICPHHIRTEIRTETCADGRLRKKTPDETIV